MVILGELTRDGERLPVTNRRSSSSVLENPCNNYHKKTRDELDREFLELMSELLCEVRSIKTQMQSMHESIASSQDSHRRNC